ncbi:MAG: RagB/SusD family nutrient uptake outer membrane protein [Dysgonamonadaceae bacterium]|jgi:hypothetical protein|nr:RagB/SusD family nutrient uptake outer membrane protein [Dysgonamonadaceae bacterium]
MKQIILFSTLILSLIFASCGDYLDKLPEEDMSMEDAFSSYTYAKEFLANAYMHLPAELNFMCGQHDTWARGVWTAGCDEMEIAYGGAASHLINNGSLSPETAENVCPVWSECYMGIRKANLFLEYIDLTPLELAGSNNMVDAFTEEDRKNWKGEAIFLRAFANYQLIRTYGPIVILDHSLPTDATFNDYRRSPLVDCIQAVIDDCDLAASMLPVRYNLNNSTENPKLGRATKGAALALKSRMLLYAASPLYNGCEYYRDFVDNEGVQLFPQSEDRSKWATAAQATLECIQTLEAAGHKLYTGTTDRNMVDNYRNIFWDLFNDEWIYWRNIGRWDHFDNCSNTLSRKGFSILNPTQEMIDAFQMADGSTPITGYQADGMTPIINAASNYVETGYATTAGPDGQWPAGVRNMFVNREPRFYALTQYPGSIWQGNVCTFWWAGADGRRGAGSDYCKTGYLLGKIVNPNANPSNGTGYQMRAWVYFRMAEMYLNYAEAINEAEGPAKAYEYVNRVRGRAGLPNLPTGLDQAGMRAAVRHERRIELAYEAQRYFDSRRWMIAPETENKPIHCLNIFAGENQQDDAFYQRIVCEDRSFETKNYFFPMPYAEISKSNHNLVQNKGYSAD